MDIFLAILLAVSQVAGVAGFVLGIYNYRQARKAHQYALEAPKRADQRGFREDLWRVLYAFEIKCETALGAIRFGEEIPEEISPEIANADARLDELGLVLIAPGKSHIQLLKAIVVGIRQDWSHLNQVRRQINFDNEMREIGGRPPKNDDDARMRQRNAAEKVLQEALEEGITHAEKYLSIIVAINNGDDYMYQNYQG